MCYPPQNRLLHPKYFQEAQCVKALFRGYLKELKEAGLESHYAEHGYGLYPTDSNGVPFTVSYFATTGDPLADLSEDMAAEQKARATYENLINLTDDPDVIGPLLFLRQREIIHFARFKELFDEYKSKGIK